MNNDMAIAALKGLKDRTPYTNERIALDMAIEALALKEPLYTYNVTCNVCGDCEYILSTQVEALNGADAYKKGSDKIYAEHPTVKHIENVEVVKIDN